MPSATGSPFAHEPSSPDAAPYGAATSTAAHRLRALDALLDRNVRELQQLYANARTPRIGDVSGDLRGRMLAWPSLDGRPAIASAVRAFAGSKGFPWRGKSFDPKGETRGDGINRVVSDRFRLFRFETFIGPSKAGDFDALQLDYGLPSNPPVIRSIEDEIRELGPGLWLGQAYVKMRSRRILWLFFALAQASA